MLIIDIKYLSVQVKSKIQNLIHYITIHYHNTLQLYTIVSIVYRYLIRYLPIYNIIFVFFSNLNLITYFIIKKKLIVIIYM